MSLELLIQSSNKYGRDEEDVLAGGGNTSWKNKGIMYVKASGTSLGDIQASGFVKMDLKKLNGIWSRSYSDNEELREKEVLGDLLASCISGEKDKRPSVESLLHGLIPHDYIIHTHPALVNGLTCSCRGQAVAGELFGDKALWIPVVNPGYTLAREVRDRIDRHLAAGKSYPLYIFLQNHGVFVGGESVEDLDALYADLFSAIKTRVGIFPDSGTLEIPLKDIKTAKKQIQAALGGDISVVSLSNRDILALSSSRESFAPLEFSMTPDHIVYYGFKALYSESVKTLGQEISLFHRQHGKFPRLAVVADMGAFAFCKGQSRAETAMKLFADDVRIAVYAKSFGGHQFMPRDKIDFIRNWEAEQYRASVSP